MRSIGSFGSFAGVFPAVAAGVGEADGLGDGCCAKEAIGESAKMNSSRKAAWRLNILISWVFQNMISKGYEIVEGHNTERARDYKPGTRLYSKLAADERGLVESESRSNEETTSEIQKMEKRGVRRVGLPPRHGHNSSVKKGGGTPPFLT